MLVVFSSLTNWVKEIFLVEDESLIGLSRLKKAKRHVTKPENNKKNKKSLKISDLVRGEIY